jgi:hypothetical protein
MSDRPTPETDAEFPKLYESATEWVDADFARRLERERDAARIMHNTPTPETDVLWDRYRNEMTQGGQFAVGPRELYDHARRLERERDEAREQWRMSSVCRELNDANERMAKKLAQTLDERDMLAEALRPFIDGWSHKSCDSIVTEKQFRCAKQALAAVKGDQP